MRLRPRYMHLAAALTALAFSFWARNVSAQTNSAERTFHVPKKTVEKALKQLQPALSGHLPTLEGFVQADGHPLSQYQRAFYQCTVRVSETSSGSVVHVNANVTAWYKDTNAAHSGYQLLKSNGRLEADLLDQLGDQLSSTSAPTPASTQEKPSVAGTTKTNGSGLDLPVVSAPLPSVPENNSVFSSSPSTAAESSQSRSFSEGKPADKKSADLRAEVSGFEDAIRNQSRPKNLVAVKKSGTPVVASSSLNAKTLFLADAQDEFELLDYNADWVHVRISGLSRGWIWRTSLEMPEGISDVPKSVVPAAPTAADLFQVSREEMAPFPGDWAPLRGKSVKIISVQKIREDEKGGGASAKLEFAKALLDQSYDELSKSPDLAGLVLIFDSSDGGMIAATLPTIRKWKAGSLSDAAMWHQCYFDPPETFTISSAATGR